MGDLSDPGRELLQQDIAGYLKEHVWYKKHGQPVLSIRTWPFWKGQFHPTSVYLRCAILNRREAQIFAQVEGAGIGNVDTIQESQKVKNDQKWHEVEVDAGHDLPLRGMRRTHHARIVVIRKSIITTGMIRVVGGCLASVLGFLFHRAGYISQGEFSISRDIAAAAAQMGEDNVHEDFPNMLG